MLCIHREYNMYISVGNTILRGFSTPKPYIKHYEYERIFESIGLKHESLILSISNHRTIAPFTVSLFCLYIFIHIFYISNTLFVMFHALLFIAGYIQGLCSHIIIHACRNLYLILFSWFWIKHYQTKGSIFGWFLANVDMDGNTQQYSVLDVYIRINIYIYCIFEYLIRSKSRAFAKNWCCRNMLQ